MERDYEILGVPEGAEQREIKKAYFKLVRRFSPERDPERFQEIRGAYERLTQEEKQENVRLSMEMPDKPFAHAMLRQMIAQEKQGEYEKAVETAKEALHRFGEYEVFLYELAVSQLRGGHSGNAIKNFEKLAGKYPEKAVYRRELAVAYFERGYGKKAFDAFEEAYAAGVRDNDFLLQFSLCCSDRGRESRGIEILLEMVRDCGAPAKRDMQDYLEAYMGLFSLSFTTCSDFYPKILEMYTGFLKTSGRALRDYTDMLSDLTLFLVKSFDRPEYLSQLNEVLEATKKPLPERIYAEEWKTISEILLETRIHLDERLDGEWMDCYEAYYTAYYFFDEAVIRFVQLEMKLFLLERVEELSPQFEIIRTEYPELCERMKDFFELLEQGNIPYMLEKLRKEYAFSSRDIEGGHYYEVYPQYKPVREKIQWDSCENGAYTRLDRKIGRNDPCPCGSGKKYKKCCGR